MQHTTRFSTGRLPSCAIWLNESLLSPLPPPLCCHRLGPREGDWRYCQIHAGGQHVIKDAQMKTVTHCLRARTVHKKTPQYQMYPVYQHSFAVTKDYVRL